MSGETQTIGGLTEKTKSGITDVADAWVPFYDANLNDDFKMSINEILDGVLTSSSLVTISNETEIYSPSHGLSAGSAGKPVGWRSDGKPYVFNDAADTEQPVGILQSVVDTDTITISPFGAVTEIPVSLLDSPSSGDWLYWDSSDATYEILSNADTVQDQKLLYYIGLKEGDATTGICMILPSEARESAVANILDFGAVADGSTDNSAAFTKAISTGRPIIRVPASADGSSYVVSEAVTITSDNQWIVGDGPGSIIELDDTDSDENVVEFTGSSTTVRINNNGISNIWIKGPADNFTPSAQPSQTSYGVGIRAYYVTRFTVKNCFISHCTGNHVFLYGVGAADIRDNWCFENYNNFSGSWTNYNADIVVYLGCEDVRLCGNHCHSNSQLHIYIPYEVGSVLISDNVCFVATDEGNPVRPHFGLYEPWASCKHNIALNYGNNENTGDRGRIIVSNNLCSSAKWSGLYIHVPGYSAAQYANTGQRVLVSGNIFHATSYFNDNAAGSPTMTAGVSILGQFRELLFTGNLLIDHKAVPFARPALQINNYCQTGATVVANNIFSNSMCGGIYCTTESSNVLIDGNYLHNCGGRGYYPIHVYHNGSLASSKTVSAIDTGTDVFTSTSHGWTSVDDGIAIRFSLGSTSSFFKADGIVVEETKLFYLKYVDGNTFQVSETPGGSAIDVTATFSGTLYATELKHIGGHVISNNMILAHFEQLLSEPIEFEDTAINTGTDRFTIEDHGLETGDEIVFDTEDTIFQISSSDVGNGTLYYVSKIDGDTFQVKPDSGSSACDLTSVGTGPHSFRISRRDSTIGGIYATLTASDHAQVIRDNVVISAAEYAGTYGIGSTPGIIHNQTGPVVIHGNYIDGWYYGIRGTGSVTARRVDEQSYSNNVIRRCAIPLRQIGTVNGLTIFDDSNVLDPALSDYRVWESASDVGMQGTRRGPNVIVQRANINNQTFSFTNGSSTINCTSHGYTDGDMVQLTGTPPSGFSTATNYWVDSSTANTLKLTSTRAGTQVTAGADGTATAVQQLPAWGTWVVGDRIENTAWADYYDWVDAVCTTAGAVGTCVFQKRYSSHGVIDAHGAIYCKDASTAQTVTASTPTKVTGFTNAGLYENMTVDIANDKLTIDYDGIYLINFQISFSGTVSSSVEFFIRSGGTPAEQYIGCKRVLGTGGDVGSASCSGLLSLEQGNDVEVWAESSHTSFTPLHMQLTAHKVG